MFVETPVLVLLHNGIFSYGMDILGVLDVKESITLWDGGCLDGLHCVWTKAYFEGAVFYTSCM